MFQAGDQAYGQLVLAHFGLGSSHIIGHTAVLPGHGLRIQEAIGGARIGITGLPHAAGIDNERLAVQGYNLIVSGQMQAHCPFGILFENGGRMGVTNQTIGGVKMLEICRCRFII